MLVANYLANWVAEYLRQSFWLIDKFLRELICYLPLKEYKFVKTWWQSG